MNGCAELIEELYRTDGPGLLQYIRQCGGGSRSEDLLQETFVRVLEKPEKIRKARSPRAWLYGVARHVVKNSLRRNARNVRLIIDLPAPDSTETDPRIPLIRSAIKKLPNDQQEVLRLRIEAELSYEEIAAVLGIPVGTVRSRLHYAVRNLRSAVRGKEVDYE